MKTVLILTMALCAIAIIIGLIRELAAERAARPAPPSFESWSRNLQAVYADWRGERRYYPACYRALFERNDKARIDWARTVAARLERSAGREPWGLESGSDPEREFKQQYAWELCLCELGQTA